MVAREADDGPQYFNETRRDFRARGHSGKSPIFVEYRNGRQYPRPLR